MRPIIKRTDATMATSQRCRNRTGSFSDTTTLPQTSEVKKMRRRSTRTGLSVSSRRAINFDDFVNKRFLNTLPFLCINQRANVKTHQIHIEMCN
ncbi:unnamed protein product [Dracunculus medinensis]|uniref:Uncharacterized protein n=1 Tax=Dracunculus medinensis TaxID=318479 RepID=A0A0N4U5A9_DRAME|nr:unnamed protein product [Dracunculus medinensis]